MGLVDILIIIFIIFGGISGYKKGAVKAIVSAVGLVLITVLSFIFKNPLSVVFYENLPFFNFDGIFKGVSVLNIALYEIIAFLLVFLVLMLVWRLVVIASNIVQKIINATIILGFPSKIIGFLIGIIEYYIITFVVIYILSLPVFGFDFFIRSNVANGILNKTPVISDMVGDVSFLDEFINLKDSYKNSKNSDKFNYDTLDLFLKYDIVSIDSVLKLKEQNKLKVDGIDNLILKYKK